MWDNMRFCCWGRPYKLTLHIPSSAPSGAWLHGNDDRGPRRRQRRRHVSRGPTGAVCLRQTKTSLDAWRTCRCRYGHRRCAGPTEQPISAVSEDLARLPSSPAVRRQVPGRLPRRPAARGAAGRQAWRARICAARRPAVQQRGPVGFAVGRHREQYPWAVQDTHGPRRRQGKRPLRRNRPMAAIATGAGCRMDNIQSRQPGGVSGAAAGRQIRYAVSGRRRGSTPLSVR